MNKTLTLLFFCLFFYKVNAQTAPGPAEREITDSVCNCLAKVDINKITSKEDAVKAITTCFAKRTDLLMKVADEMKVDATDKAAMRGVGTKIGKDLLTENCAAFTQLSLKMVESEKTETNDNDGITTGTFKRINLKGFNYIVVADKSGSETSFIWLRQFPGSEKFMGATVKYVGKKLKINWQELEVYLPLAKGYYKVKEITGIEML